MTIKNKAKTNIMKELITKKEKAPILPQVGDIIEGRIIKISKNELILELGPLGTGIIYGAELRENKDMIRNLKIGETISALVLDQENDDGYTELSFKEANLEKSWNDLRDKKEEGEPVDVKVIEANRGGLVIRLSSIVGFLPVSQLSSENYPRVEGGDKNKILSHLNEFIGKKIKVKIISLDKKTEKLVVSEKALQEKEMEESLNKYKKGDIVEGTVTALTDFGAFIKFNDNLEGLVHISELGWEIIDHPNQVLKENEKIKVQIIDIQNNQVSLSLRALKKDPWENIEKKYQNDQIVKAKVIKFSPSGAFVEVDKGINGLVHSSEFSKENKEMEDVLEIGKSYDFKILSLSPAMHKMSLGLNN